MGLLEVLFLAASDHFVVLGLNQVSRYVKKHQMRVLLPNPKPLSSVVVTVSHECTL